MLCRDKPVAALIIGDGEFFLCITVVNRFPEYLVHFMTGVRGGTKRNFTRKAISTERFITVYYIRHSIIGVLFENLYAVALH